MNPFTIPLQGINLIEASAGTGKTYTIETLFIRLLLEKPLLVDKILVVTFTKAATEELRARIRQRLQQALMAFEQGHSQDIGLAEFIKYYPNSRYITQQLSSALRGFDEAAIFTIHSFCQQILRDNAFDSGILFDVELVGNQLSLLRETVEDFWREHIYQASPLFINYLAKSGYDRPSRFLETLENGKYVGHLFLTILPTFEPISGSSEQAFHQAYSIAQQSWQQHSVEIETLFLTYKWLNRNKYAEKSIPNWCKDLSSYFATAPSVILPEKFEKFTVHHLHTSVKKDGKPPVHDFFELCEQLWQQQQALDKHFSKQLLVLKIKLFSSIEKKLTHKKQKLNIQSFDDLLHKLHYSLYNGSGDHLATQIRTKYHAALIDEFQDTDRVQYEIFQRIFGKRHPLFLIGDPKQAIYAFRGADIFTYMQASSDAAQRHTLPINWRSQATLIHAINTLFSRIDNPFLLEKIAFNPVQPPEQNKPHLVLGQQPSPPLQIWLVNRENNKLPTDKPINKAWADYQIPLAVGYEIARLLQLGDQRIAMIGDKPLIAGDIAILVRTNRQAQLMQKALLQLQIPSVLFSRDSLFTTQEVMEIERILLAIANPQQEPLIKAALTTELFGVTGNQLYHLLETDADWQIYLNRFYHYYSVWQTVGFIQMFRELLSKEQVPERLLSYPDGERRLTNVLHAAEVLQQAAVQKKLSMSSLCRWLAEQRSQETESDAEELQLRLESDENRVKIVTIHKSKGLEYPIVFCPFAWDGALHTQKAKQFTFHDTAEHLTLDLGSEHQETHRERAIFEEQAEQMRLFYVAVTRAKHRCYLVWGAFNGADTSPLARLLHPIFEIKITDDNTLRAELQQLVNQATDAIQVSDLPINKTVYQRSKPETSQLQARQFSGTINKLWKITSFSALEAATHHIDKIDSPDRDEITVSPKLKNNFADTNKDIFKFPSGARAGTLIHTLFEKIDFIQPDTQIITDQLKMAGYEEEWQPVLMNLLIEVLNTPLEANCPEFTLSNISVDKRLNELEFFYPLRPITSEGLQAVFTDKFLVSDREIELAMENLEFSPVCGFMKGFIDMVFEYRGRFYLVDYKSHLLGHYQQAYCRDNLVKVMAQENYFLQYHLYTVALHRYLATRLPNYHYEQHIGGVYYLFVRGMRQQWGANSGIYRDLPTAALINKLSHYLGG